MEGDRRREIRDLMAIFLMDFAQSSNAKPSPKMA